MSEMSELLKSTPVGRLQSPLQGFGLAARVQTARPEHGVRASELTHLGYLVLRGRPDDAAFLQRTAEVLGVPLPTEPRRLAVGSAGAVVWLSPDEWLLACRRSQRDPLQAALTAATQGLHAQVVDNSGGYTALRLSGRDHLTLLRHLGPYDFQSQAIGLCISTVAQRAAITVVRCDMAGVVVIFRRSFADYLWRLIERSARPYGLAIVPASSHADPVFTPLVEVA